MFIEPRRKNNNKKKKIRVRHSPMTTLLLLLFAETGETVDREVFPGFYIVPDTCNKIVKFI